MGRRKKIVEESNEIVDDSAEMPRGPSKEFHWSDDGPQYNVMIELSDSVPSTRHYKTFLETNDLAIAKHECLAMFEDENKTTFIMDRSDHNREILRYEASPKIKEDNHDDTTANESTQSRDRKPRPFTVKRKQ